MMSFALTRNIRFYSHATRSVMHLRYFTQMGKHNKSSQRMKPNKTPEELKHKHQRQEEDALRMKNNSLTKAKPDSPEFDYVRRKIDGCKTSEEVMKIVYEFEKVGDHSIFTKAMKKNARLLYKNLSQHSDAKNKLFKLWDMIDKDDISSAVPHGILLDCCNKLKCFEKCDEIFNAMLDAGIKPTNQILSNMLESTNGDVSKAQKYWKLMINNYDIVPDEQNYISIFAVFAAVNDVKSAGDMFIESPYHNSFKVCTGLLNCFALSGAINEMETLINHMTTQNMIFDDFVYQAMMICYVKGGQPTKAIDAYNESQKQNVLSLAILRLLPTAYMTLIDLENNFSARKKLLKIVLEELPMRLLSFSGNQQKYLDSERWGLFVLEGTMKTYRENFGWRTFEEITDKYPLPLLQTNENAPLECYLRLYDMNIAKFILFEYL
eukprot:57974_1